MLNCIGTSHTVTFILLFPMYSVCIRKNFDDMLLPASLTTNFSDGSRTSQVAKLRLQKYLAGIPAAFSISSNVSFLNSSQPLGPL